MNFTDVLGTWKQIKEYIDTKISSSGADSLPVGTKMWSYNGSNVFGSNYIKSRDNDSLYIISDSKILSSVNDYTNLNMNYKRFEWSKIFFITEGFTGDEFEIIYYYPSSVHHLKVNGQTVNDTIITSLVSYGYSSTYHFLGSKKIQNNYYLLFYNGNTKSLEFAVYDGLTTKNIKVNNAYDSSVYAFTDCAFTDEYVYFVRKGYNLKYIKISDSMELQESEVLVGADDYFVVANNNVYTFGKNGISILTHNKSTVINSDLTNTSANNYFILASDDIIYIDYFLNNYKSYYYSISENKYKSINSGIINKYKKFNIAVYDYSKLKILKDNEDAVNSESEYIKKFNSRFVYYINEKYILNLTSVNSNGYFYIRSFTENLKLTPNDTNNTLYYIKYK